LGFGGVGMTTKILPLPPGDEYMNEYILVYAFLFGGTFLASCLIGYALKGIWRRIRKHD
jgi:hypothetical protein